MSVLFNKLKAYICQKLGHIPGKTWDYNGYRRSKCVCCGENITRFYGTWE